MTATPSLDWIREVDTDLANLDEKPQFGFATSFDEQKLTQGLRELFGRPDLSLTHTIKGWVDPSQLFEGLGESLAPLAIHWSPLPTPAYFVTNQTTLKELMADLFESPEGGEYFYQSSLAQGFYDYFAAEVLRQLTLQSFAAPLAPRMAPKVSNIREMLGDAPHFVIDVVLGMKGKNYWGRVLLSDRFRREWKTYFVQQGAPPRAETVRSKLMVELGLEIGNTRLNLEEWKQVKRGDFVILDHCSYDPETHKGAVVLTLQQKPLFRGRLKAKGLKITNYPVYEEVSNPMEEDTEGLYKDLGDDELSEFDQEDDLFSDLEAQEETTEASTEEEMPAPSHDFASETLADLPLQLTVEIGRLRITAGELLNLAPGNLLDLSVAPEQGVDLVINGKKVGRGELIRMGEVLGVRILNL